MKITFPKMFSNECYHPPNFFVMNVSIPKNTFCNECHHMEKKFPPGFFYKHIAFIFIIVLFFSLNICFFHQESQNEVTKHFINTRKTWKRGNINKEIKRKTVKKYKTENTKKKVKRKTTGKSLFYTSSGRNWFYIGKQRIIFHWEFI